jgi:hypothetical protein
MSKWRRQPSDNTVSSALNGKPFSVSNRQALNRFVGNKTISKIVEKIYTAPCSRIIPMESLELDPYRYQSKVDILSTNYSTQFLDLLQDCSSACTTTASLSFNTSQIIKRV